MNCVEEKRKGGRELDYRKEFRSNIHTNTEIQV